MSNLAPNEEDVIYADPSKRFFIEMLTRDITLSDCILDLLDNSIHSLISETKLDVMKILVGKKSAKKVKASVSINFDKDHFSIEDNCGGISVEHAKNDVFKFGNPEPNDSNTGLGVYGIGMKRAFFKLGKLINVESSTQKEKFKILIDVDNWVKDPSDWTFKFKSIQKRNAKSGGTKIIVEKLNGLASRNFSQIPFKNELLRRIQTTYALFLEAGVSITVNGTKAKPELPEFATSSEISSVRHLFEEDGVDILITAGLSPYSDRKARGWYVFCNGRMVLEADKTTTTGWGTNSIPNFHAKFNHFLGYVYFRSTDVYKLPWRTTKYGVESDSSIYQAALAEMRVLSRPILNFLNNMYPGEIDPTGVAERRALEKASSIKVNQVAKKQETLFKADLKKKKEDNIVNILYKKPTKMVDKVKAVIGKKRMSAAKVGEYTFDYFYEQECE